jgi:hypothetical protein
MDARCDTVVRITARDGVKARALWELFREETGSAMSLTRFDVEMVRFAADPRVPFGSKVTRMHGTFYPLKASGT